MTYLLNCSWVFKSPTLEKTSQDLSGRSLRMLERFCEELHWVCGELDAYTIIPHQLHFLNILIGFSLSFHQWLIVYELKLGLKMVGHYINSQHCIYICPEEWELWVFNFSFSCYLRCLKKSYWQFGIASELHCPCPLPLCTELVTEEVKNYNGFKGCHEFMEKITTGICLNFLTNALLFSAGECYQTWQWLKTWGQVWELSVSIGFGSSAEPIVEGVY